MELVSVTVPTSHSVFDCLFRKDVENVEKMALIMSERSILMYQLPTYFKSLH